MNAPNYLHGITNGEFDWLLAEIYPVSRNTRDLFHREEIDAEALGLMMADPEERAWLVDNLGENSTDISELTQLWNAKMNNYFQTVLNLPPLPVTPPPRVENLEDLAPPHLVRTRRSEFDFLSENWESTRLVLNDLFDMPVVIPYEPYELSIL